VALWEYPYGSPIDLDVEITAGTIAITGAQTDTITVRTGPPGSGTWPDPAGDLDVTFDAGHLTVAEPRGAGGWRLRSGQVVLAITVPAGSRCTLRTTAADIGCEGELGSLDAQTSAGSVSAAVVRGRVRVRTATGQIKVDEVSGEVSAHTASGRIRIGHAAGDITTTSASGEIQIGSADASVSARTATGRVRISSVARGQANVTTASGDIDVAVARGTGVYLDLSSATGRVSSDLEPSLQHNGADLHLTCRTVTGALRVVSAEYAGAAR